MGVGCGLSLDDMRANVGSMASWAAMGRATGAVERRARAASTSRGRLRAKRDAMWVRETDGRSNVLRERRLDRRARVKDAPRGCLKSKSKRFAKRLTCLTPMGAEPSTRRNLRLRCVLLVSNRTRMKSRR